MRPRFGDFPTVDVAIENDDDWRSHVVASSRIPNSVHLKPDGKAAVKYMIDGRTKKNPDLLSIVVADPFEDPIKDDGEGCMTLSEIGKELGISGEYVRLIQERALRKLRGPKRSKFLKGFCGEGER